MTGILRYRPRAGQTHVGVHGVSTACCDQRQNRRPRRNSHNDCSLMDNDQLLRIMQGALSGEQGRAVTGTISNIADDCEFVYF